MIIKIAENLLVQGFVQEGDEYPLLVQPCYPNGKPFENESAAISWGNYWVEFMENETAPEPPTGPGEMPTPRSRLVDDILQQWNSETENWDVIATPVEEPTEEETNA